MKWFKATLWVPANDDDDVMFGTIRILAANAVNAEDMLTALLGGKINLCYDDFEEENADA